MNELKAPLRSEGQRLIRASGYGVTEISRELKVTKGAVSLWFSGQRVPTSDVRRDIEKLLGIAVSAWDARPTAETAPAAQVRKTLRTKKPVRPRLPLGEPADPTADAREAIVNDYARAARKAAAETPFRPERPPVQDTPDSDPLAGVRALVAQCRVGIAMQDLSAAEAKSWQDRLLSALRMEQTMVQAEAQHEDAIARSAVWARVWGGVSKALRPYPDALKAAIDSLPEGMR